MRFYEPTREQEQAYIAWANTRPAHVRDVVLRLVPWELYLLKSSKHRVTIYSFEETMDERVQCTVTVSGRFNIVMFERNVFGIDPDDLEPCDLPGPDEVTGSAMTLEQAAANIDELRLRARPDLWMRDPITRKAVLRLKS